MTTPKGISTDDEDLIWCKQSLLRVLAYVSLLRPSKRNELCAMLNDVESHDQVDLKAIEYLIMALDIYKEDDPE
jgi:hypothetical protein